MVLIKKFIFILILINILLAATVNSGELTYAKCSSFCVCDLYFDLNRAQCSGKRLISAELDLPKQVQILYLNYNEITQIESTCFKKFYYLQYLNLAHNAIYNLELEAFSRLKNLRDIDLSYNRLEYLDERTFERNPQLIRVNLEGNKFMSLDVSRPLIRNPSLQQLNLANCQINSLNPQMFIYLADLQDLDLSNNLLNHFYTFFKNLYSQRNFQLKISQNSIKCTPDVQQQLQIFKDSNISVEFPECSVLDVNPAIPENIEKFQRMVMQPTDMQADSPSQTENKLNFGIGVENLSQIAYWHMTLKKMFADSDEEDQDDNDEREHEDTGAAEQNHDILNASEENLANMQLIRLSPDQVLCDGTKHTVCRKYRSCLNDMNKMWHEQQDLKSTRDLKLAFILGVATGITSCVCLISFALCLKNCYEAQKQKILDPSSDPDALSEVHSQPMSRPTSQLPHRQPRRRPPRARPVVRYEGPVAENFLSRLFGRPARQQYYRSINQNTATLIRRLSRSNLLNNRLSQNFATERQTSSSDGDGNFRGDNYSASAPRPETPPPLYADVVVLPDLEDRK